MLLHSRPQSRSALTTSCAKGKSSGVDTECHCCQEHASACMIGNASVVGRTLSPYRCQRPLLSGNEPRREQGPAKRLQHHPTLLDELNSVERGGQTNATCLTQHLDSRIWDQKLPRILHSKRFRLCAFRFLTARKLGRKRGGRGEERMETLADKPQDLTKRVRPQPRSSDWCGCYV